MIAIPVGKRSEPPSGYLLAQSTRTAAVAYFFVAILGFSFWFFMAVPFASHRESYWWLANVHSYPFCHAFGFIVTTYRPLAQAATWLGFLSVNASGFPTSALRQGLLQGFIYGLFVLAWWLIYRAAAERRMVAMVALASGCVFFPAYINLFHILRNLLRSNCVDARLFTSPPLRGHV
jgi:hypothetical protein